LKFYGKKEPISKAAISIAASVANGFQKSKLKPVLKEGCGVLNVNILCGLEGVIIGKTEKGRKALQFLQIFKTSGTFNIDIEIEKEREKERESIHLAQKKI